MIVEYRTRLTDLLSLENHPRRLCAPGDFLMLAAYFAVFFAGSVSAADVPLCLVFVEYCLYAVRHHTVEHLQPLGYVFMYGRS